MHDQFDTLARMYEDMFRLPWRRHLEKHSVLSALGSFGDRAVLDVGCGTGVYTREVRRRGAARVTGYDVSEGMVARARLIERGEPLGIEYSTEPPDPATDCYDLALGVYVLPYAEDYRSLVNVCAAAGRVLRPGGLFVTLPVNPDYDGRRDYYARYGFRLWDAEPRADASRVTLELAFGPYHEKITARHWSRTTLERALAEASFTDVTWLDFQVAPQGVQEHGREFWAPYLCCPHASLITCRKK
ncbi:class I SAM-dependent methyltransferase [Actinomadura sp. KC06]|uniref:class I SAM-dependent DNA methyltransferase n=1 Tax=Actinomadura sp. KC06 TaxID=2530369 RepID=UPI0014049E2A|nr:class I SAM-dependent methyltransferase [Actinomadura sp. KC06]